MGNDHAATLVSGQLREHFPASRGVAVKAPNIAFDCINQGAAQQRIMALPTSTRRTGQPLQLFLGEIIVVRARPGDCDKRLDSSKATVAQCDPAHGIHIGLAICIIDWPARECHWGQRRGNVIRRWAESGHLLPEAGHRSLWNFNHDWINGRKSRTQLQYDAPILPSQHLQLPDRNAHVKITQ